MKIEMIIKVIMVSVGLFLPAGCQSVKEQQNVAQQRWQKTTVKIRLNVAQEQFDNGDYDNAMKTVNEALEMDPEFMEAWIFAGKVSLVKGDLQKAFESFSKAIALDEESDQAWFWLGTAAIEDGNSPYAEKCFKTAADLDRKKIDYIMSLAHVYIMQGKYDSAERLYEEKSSLFSNDYTIKTAAGSLAMMSGRYDKAIKYYRQAVILSKENPSVLESLGYCYIAARQWSDAADVFEKLADAADSESRQNYKHIEAICDMNAGRYSKAKAGYDTLSDIQRDKPEFWLNLGQAHLGTGSANAAMACAKRAQALNPNWSEAIALQASAEYLNKDYQSAMKNFQTISSDETVGAFAWLMIGRCYDKLGQTGEAKNAYENSLNLKPDNVYTAKLAGK